MEFANVIGLIAIVIIMVIGVVIIEIRGSSLRDIVISKSTLGAEGANNLNALLKSEINTQNFVDYFFELRSKGTDAIKNDKQFNEHIGNFFKDKKISFYIAEQKATKTNALFNIKYKKINERSEESRKAMIKDVVFMVTAYA